MGLVHEQNAPTTFGSRQGPLIALQVFFVSIALVIYCLRVYTRAFILRSAASDDHLMGIAMLFSIAVSVNACVSTKYGWGKHLDEVPAENYGPILLCVWLSELLFILSTTFMKLSILFFYLRIAVTTTYRRVIHGSIALISSFGIAFSCVVIFQCIPIHDYWDPISKKCLSPEVPMFLHGIINTLTDVYVYVLPMRMVWKTQIPKRQRMGLIIIFGAGFLVCVAGALRLYFSIISQESKDATWDGFNLWTWETIELNLGIVCASAPCLKALVARILPKLMASHSASNHTPAAHYQMNSKRPAGGHRHYSLESMKGNRRDEELARESDESQEDLTKSQHQISMASVDSRWLV